MSIVNSFKSRLVSVVIPYFYNRDELVLCLNSLKNQDYSAFEVVVVNDGSDDISLLVNEYEAHLELQYLYIPRTKESSRAKARNAGIHISKGEFLLFLDSDQVVSSGFITSHMACVAEASRFGVTDLLSFGTRRRVNVDKVHSTSTYCELEKEFLESNDERISLLDTIEKVRGLESFLWLLTYSHNLLVPKKLVDQFGGFDESFLGWGLEDTEFAYRLHKNKCRIIYNPSSSTIDVSKPKTEDASNEKSWYQNYLVISSKHSDFSISMLEVFNYYFDSDKNRLLRNTGIEYTWDWCFKNYVLLIKSTQSYAPPSDSEVSSQIEVDELCLNDYIKHILEV